MSILSPGCQSVQIHKMALTARGYKQDTGSCSTEHLGGYIIGTYPVESGLLLEWLGEWCKFLSKLKHFSKQIVLSKVKIHTRSKNL